MKMKDYVGDSKKRLLNACHEAVEAELRNDIGSFWVTNYRRLMRGNFRMVGLSVRGWFGQRFKRG
jgi:hypothetical protein